MKHELFLDWSPDFRDHAALSRQLVATNRINGGPSGQRSVAVIVRDPDTGEATSGVWGVILYGWLYIELLYVAEPDRRLGLGSRLVGSVEKAARESGCAGSWLTTYAFQISGFCEKIGYQRFGDLGVAPPPGQGADHRIIFYRKLFEQTANV